MSIDHSAPLKGVVICCTSIPDEKRTAISLCAEQMGALHHLDLTRDVTHLIIGSYDTLKYKYVARNRQDILPMAPSWIDAIRDLWINDEEIDLEAMEQKYKLPTFHSLKFSMTGCEEPAERLGISELVKKNGATYDGDLTRSITHLISLRTDGAKYKAAKSWGIKIVSIEWLYQSLERGMILEEKLFDPALPKEERGKGAWDKAPPLIPSLVRRLKPESNTGSEIGQRKLRRTASMKLSGQHDSLLADISGNSVSKSQLNGAREFEKPTQIKRSAITDQSKLQTVQTYSEDQSPAKIKGVFTGCVFWLYDFSNTKIKVLQNHILSCGGEVMHTGNKSVPLPTVLPEGRQSQRLFMVVSHDLPKDDVPILPKSYPIEVVTVWWIERCLHHKQLLEPKQHVIGRPFPVFPIPEIVAKKMMICSSAFSGIDLLHLTRAIELIGGTYSDFMTPHASLLIVNNINIVRKEKLNYAKEWKIPIVTVNWLWDSIETGSSLSTQAYEFRPEKMLESTLTLKEKPLNIVEMEQEISSIVPVNPSLIADKDTIPTQKRPPQPASNTSCEINDIEEKSKEAEKKVILIPSQSQAEPLIISNHPENNNSSLTHDMTMVTGPTEKSATLNRPSEDITHAISSLLAKSKGTNSIQSLERTETRKRSRILGRVTSNTSNHSLATSVDSTATHGDPVQWLSNFSDQTANERIEMLLNGDKAWMSNIENNNLPSTQLEYEDPDSTVAREVIMARMRGEVVDFEMVKKLENKRTISAFDNSKEMMSKARKRARGSNTR